MLENKALAEVKTAFNATQGPLLGQVDCGGSAPGTNQMEAGGRVEKRDLKLCLTSMSPRDRQP